MTTEQHAKILSAYLYRLTLADLRKILEQSEACWHSAMNHGMSGQLEERYKMDSVILSAVQNMTAHDLEIIAK